MSEIEPSHEQQGDWTPVAEEVGRIDEQEQQDLRAAEYVSDDDKVSILTEEGHRYLLQGENAHATVTELGVTMAAMKGVVTASIADSLSTITYQVQTEINQLRDAGYT